jgi:hypothetical protein
MKNLFLWIFSILYSNYLFSQLEEQQFISGGTIIVAAKCKNGIMVAADSRMSTYNNDHPEWVAFYTDNVQKLFKAGRYVVGFAGQSHYKDFSIAKILDSFLLTNPLYKDPSHFLYLFGLFLRKNFKPLFDYYLKTGRVVCCGFYDHKPYVASFRDGAVYVNKEGIFTSTPTYYLKYDSSKNCVEQQKYVKEFIEKFPLTDDEKSVVGGKTQIVKIDSLNKISWQTPKSNFKIYYYYKDYAKGVLNKTIKYKIVNKEYAKMALAYLQSVLDEKTNF